MERFNHKVRWGLSIFAGVVLSFTLSDVTRAQYRVETYDGHLLDASKQIGAGGYNNNNAISSQALNAQDIYLGNVTGYGAFQGVVPDKDPAAFQGFIPNQPSLLLDKQVGAVTPIAGPTYNKPQLYYNQYTAPSAAVPVQAIPGTSAYLPTPAPYQSPSDYRLGSTLDVPATPSAPAPGETVGPGQVDLTTDMTPTFLNNAPLAGVVPLTSPGNTPIAYEEPSSTNLTGSQPGISPLVTGLTARDLVRLRGELSQNTLTPSAASQVQNSPINSLVNPNAQNTAGSNSSANSTTSGAAPGGVPAPGGVQAPSGQPISGQIAGNVSQNPFAPNANSSTVNASAAPGANNFSTGAQERTNLPMPPPPAEMSPQYAKLKALYDKYQQSHPKTDEEANREFQAALQARRAYEQSLVKAPAASSTTQNPSNGNTTTAQPTLGAQPAPAPEVTNNTPPLQVGPIGADIRASGLRELVQQGEDLARKQRFKDAIGKFMDARQVAPNDMEINIDLANAQLGAGFFAESEQSLRDAFTSDPALLMGRYDLTSVIGDQRLQKLIGDLKQLAADGDSATPVFLLAYVSYNQGDTDKAVEYLHLAQTRAGGRDDLIRSLGEHWTLPATQPAK